MVALARKDAVAAPVRGWRRLAGRVVAVLALTALLMGLVVSAQNLVMMLSTREVIGEVVLVEVVSAPGEEVRAVGEYTLRVEYADSNGQFRRFDENMLTDAPPEKGAEIAVRFDPDAPTSVRIADYPWIWRTALIWGGIAFILGLVAEGLLRRAPR